MMPVDLARFSNPAYNPGNPIKRLCWYFINLLFIRNRYFPFMGFKRTILRLFGAKIGVGVVLKPGINIKYPWFLKIGNHSWIGEDVWIDNLGRVEIGKHVCISQGALLLCGNHNYKKTTFDLIVEDIILENGVWIGAKSMVTGNVTCASHSILTAGSVATKNLEAYGIYKGNPCQFIRKRKMEDEV